MSRKRLQEAATCPLWPMSDRRSISIWWFLMSLLVVFTVAFLSANRHQAQADEAIQLTEQFGIGARAMGMGGTGLAVAEDFSALYWNPAGLAQVRRIEVSGGLSHQRHTSATTYFGTADEDRENNTRLNSVGLVFPVPTYRGSLVFALGVGRVENFDALFVQRGYSSIDERWEQGREIQSGGLHAWSLGGAIDVSPTLSLGASINILDGDYHYDWDSYFADVNNIPANSPYDTTYIHDTKDADFDALSLKLGGLLRISRFIRAGMTISSPMTYDISGDVVERTLDVFDDGTADRYRDSYFFQNEISTPWEFGLGLAWSLPTVLLAGDFRYADWSQMKFDDQPLDDYDEAVSWNVGGEYVLPRIGTKIRAGYASEPIAYTGSRIVDDRTYYSLGAGFLVGQVMTLDVAWVKSSWKTRQSAVTEEKEVERIFLTMAYRF